MGRLRIIILIICGLIPATVRAESPAAPTQTQPGFASAFLIARAAEVRGDWKMAEAAFARVAKLEPESGDFLHRQSILLLNQGEFEAALGVTAQMNHANSRSSHLARLLTFAQAARSGNVTDSRAALDEFTDEGLGQFIKPFLTAWLLSAQGQADQAVKLLEQYSEPESLRPMAYLHMALIADQAGDVKRARENFARVVAVNPSYRAVALASSFYARHDLKQRRTALLQAAAKSGLEPGLLRNLATLPSDDESLRIIHWQDGISEVLFGLAALLQLEGANDVALPYLRVAQVLRPDFALVQLLIADLKVRLGHYDEARALYTALLGKADVGQMAQLRLVSLQHDLGDLEAAQAAAQAMVTAQPDWAQAWQVLGIIRLSQGAADGAEAAFTRALELGGTGSLRAGALFARAQSRHAQHNWSGTVDDLQAAIASNPSDPQVLNYLAYLWAERGVRLSEAAELAEQALLLQPEDADILDTLGWVRFRQGEHTEAVRLLELAAELRPYDPTINDHLGDAYWAQGRVQEARFQWQRAMNYRDSQAPQLVSLEELRQKIARGLMTQLTAEVQQ